jgi:hypothetical protein
MNLANHKKKIVKMIVCDGIPLFPDKHREETSQAEGGQLHINKLLNIDEATFFKYFKNDSASSTGLSEAQERINRSLGISPELFKKHNH